MKKSNILISIICPFYNNSDYIEECIKSVVSQTFKNWELILVNDGSTDCGDKIVSKYVNDDTIFLYNNDNHGALYSRYFGVRKAHGDYIYFLDGDDLLDSKTVEVLTNKIQTYAPDIIFNNVIPFSNNTGLKRNLSKNNDEKLIFKKDFNNELYFSNRYGYYHCGGTFLKTLFINNRPQEFNDLANCEDLLDTYFLVQNSNKILLIVENLYLYRINLKSKTKNLSSKDIFDRFRVVNFIYNDIGHINFDDYLRRMFSWSAFGYVTECAKMDKYKIYKNCCKQIRDSFIYKNCIYNYDFGNKRTNLVNRLLSKKMYLSLYVASRMLFKK